MKRNEEIVLTREAESYFSSAIMSPEKFDPRDCVHIGLAGRVCPNCGKTRLQIITANPNFPAATVVSARWR